MVVSQWAEQLRQKVRCHPGKLRDFAFGGIVCPPKKRTVMAADAESGAYLVHVDKSWGCKQVGVERDDASVSRRGSFPAVCIHPPEQSAIEQVSSHLERIEQWADIAINVFDRTSDLVVLPLMTGQALLRPLVVLVLERRLSWIANRCLAQQRQNRQSEQKDKTTAY